MILPLECFEGDAIVSLDCLDGDAIFSLGCLEGDETLSLRCLEGDAIFSLGCLEGVFWLENLDLVTELSEPDLSTLCRSFRLNDFFFFGGSTGG